MPPKRENQATSDRRALRLEQERRILEMRKRGFTLAAIAEALGLKSRAHIQRVLKRVLDQQTGVRDDMAREYLLLWVARSEDMVQNLYQRARGRTPRGTPGQPGYDPGEAPDYQALDRLMTIWQRQATMLGLDTKSIRLLDADGGAADISDAADRFADALGRAIGSAVAGAADGDPAPAPDPAEDDGS